MAVLQTTREGRMLRRLLLINPAFRLWCEDQQYSTCPSARVKMAQESNSETDAQRNARNNMPSSSSFTSAGSRVREFRWMSRYAPGFRMRGDDIDVLPSPASFYDTLKEEVSKAKKRIVFSSLYLGTGELEQGLVDELHAAQKENPDLQVSVLLDYTRGSRGKKNSRTMLLPLLKDFGSRARVSLYHTPELRGLIKWLLPERFNETIGVQHIKVYLFDDNLILSGANLSDSYFTNRQDRYILLRNCGHLGDYCEQLVSSVASASFQLQPDNSVKMDEDMKTHPYKGKGSDKGKAYKEEFRSRVDPVINGDNWTPSGFQDNRAFEGHLRRINGDPENVSTFDSVLNNSQDQLYKSQSEQTRFHDDSAIDSDDSTDTQDCDTWIYPMIQMSQFGIRIDEEITQRLWRDSPEESQIFLASGYFNLPTHYEKVILNESSAIFNIITAHPEANGFLGAAGPAGLIPSVYTLVTRQFYQEVRDLVQRHRVHITEYQRPGWTFHGKGLWYYPPGQELPHVTFIGSPNFGYRSVYRDIEAQFVIVTENPRLQEQLHREQEYMYKRGTEVQKQTFLQPDRYVPYWVQWFTRFCRGFF